jgi:lysophospholipase L1-like esterase
MPKLEAILAAQRRAAAAAGCAFYDQLAAMGGPGTIHTWAGEPKPRARKDHVHLTRDGYALLAGALAGDLLAAYEAWAAASPR